MAVLSHLPVEVDHVEEIILILSMPSLGKDGTVEEQADEEVLPMREIEGGGGHPEAQKYHPFTAMLPDEQVIEQM